MGHIKITPSDGVKIQLVIYVRLLDGGFKCINIINTSYIIIILFEVLESSSDLHCKTYITKVKSTSKGTRLARDIARKCVIVDLPDSTYICHIPNFANYL